MSRPIAAIEVTEVPDGGPAVPVELTTDAPDGGPALPVVQVAAGSRAQLAIAPVRMSLVASGVRARTGQRAVPIVVVAGGTPVTPPTPPSPLLTGLAARWSMDEAAGNRLDSGPNGLHLAPTGTPTQQAGKLASAVGTSSGNYLSHADHAALRTRVGMTWAVWIYASGTGDMIVASKYHPSSAKEWAAQVNVTGGVTAMFVFNTVSGFVSASVVAPAANTWTHLAFTFDAAQVLRSYKNGALSQTSAALAGTPNTSTQPMTVGAFATGATPLTGRVDELTIWHRALTAPEIAQLYNGGAGLAWPYT